MAPSISLIVLRSSDVAAARRFYKALGLVFRAEKHGSGPEHWSCPLGETTLELYPAGAQGVTTTLRLGLCVDDLPATLEALALIGARVDRPFDAATGSAVVIDPDGTKVELSQRGPQRTTRETTTWAVWRQDDNGNQFLISGGHPRDEAERLHREFEEKGHKQLYWLSADDERAS
jgi:catechol 2,3-dioxygenase-like lactoylglutathione lyase family enzyme